MSSGTVSSSWIAATNVPRARRRKGLGSSASMTLMTRSAPGSAPARVKPRSARTSPSPSMRRAKDCDVGLPVTANSMWARFYGRPRGPARYGRFVSALDLVRELEEQEASLAEMSGRLVETQATAEQVAAGAEDVGELLARLPDDRAASERELAAAKAARSDRRTE